eukprot:CAMPEP_0194244712 /NCGR_PEP_ID=MMETSP0158-20130606/11794_1 /TAXON_ID=33649 /ORGANISM="Thalassionema nitzschioides, Strain L26-B" /LENGTH=448 /DNA_ID=CAMNT_0038980269 /DNA_START=47 /DNA_END=1389 /DNA_ORIENTATION=-
MLIRIRSNVGVWRVENLDEATATVHDVMEGIKATRPNIQFENPLSKDPGCQIPLAEGTPLVQQFNLGHGSMIHCRVDPTTCAEADPSNSSSLMKRSIAKDGSIQMIQTSSDNNENGFRQGMMALRDIKMSWTLNDFIAMNSQYEFKIQRQEEAICKGVSLDTASVADFQNYMRRFNFSRQRCGYLYGTFLNDNGDDDEKTSTKNKVKVEAIYEPPQDVDEDGGFALLEDPREEEVEQLASLLGLRKVGWVIGHPPREDGFVLSANEVITAAELQLEAAGGLGEDTPFVTVTVSVGDDGNVSVEAFQVSKQCMTMVAEEALEMGPDPGFCVVNDTFTAIQEGKPSKTVSNNFFLTVVPIEQHESKLFCVAEFPRANREFDTAVSKQDLKNQLSKAGKAGWTFQDLLSDFQLLLYLSQFLDMATDLPPICESVVDSESKPLNEGYKLIIA